jgi:hypothetical protein
MYGAGCIAAGDRESRLRAGLRLMFDDADDGIPRLRQVHTGPVALVNVSGWRCVSRSGYGRDAHSPDKDGRCVFCDRKVARES